MKLKITTLFLCCFSLVSAWSQSILTGNVTDESKMPLIGVNILIEGTSKGVATDFDGNFQIEVEQGQVLKFIYVGYITKTYKVGTQSNVNILMEEDASELEEVVVIGYGSQKKESVLASISQVKGEELIKAGATNVVNALSSLAPGVNVVQSSGQPGADAGTIYIRGNANPLILVDGVEVVGGIANINPDDIESTSILKDGAATAVYGIRGANGVVIITTKRGKIGKPKVSVTSEYSVQAYDDQYDQLSAYQAESIRNIGAYNDGVFNNGYSTQTDLAHYRDQDLPYLYPDTDWADFVIKDFTSNYNQSISIRGGNEFVKYFASSSYFQQNDITQSKQFFDYDPEHKLQRYNFRANLDFQLTKTTKLKTSVSNRLENINAGGANTNAKSYINLYTLPPGGGLPFYPAEVLEQYPDPFYPGLSEIRFPISTGIGTNTSGITTTNKAVFNIDFELEQKLDFITPGLKFNGKYNFVSSNTSQRRVNFDTSLAVRLDRYDLERDGTWTSFEGQDYERPFDFTEGNETVSATSEIDLVKGQLDYERSFGKHNVTGLGVFSRIRKLTGTTFPFFEEAWVTRATYNYDKKYFLELSGSYNGDESFDRGNRFKLFPSFSFGINLAKQKFIKENIPAINNFKLRYSNGQTGTKAGLGTARWQYLGEYESIQPRQTWRYFFGEDGSLRPRVISETQIANPDLTWATVTKQNLGLEFGLLKNKISGEIDFFKDNREGLISRLTDANIPVYLGSTAALPFANINSTESHGMEVSLTYKNNTDSGFRYSITGFYGFNENRVLESSQDGPGTPSYTAVAGKPAGTQAVLQTDGFFQNIDEVVNYPTYTGVGLGDLRYIDYNANGTVIGTALEDQIRFDIPASPQHTFTLKLDGSYKNWSFGTVISGIEGHKGLLNNGLIYALPGGEASGRTDQLDYWTPTNTDARYPALHIGTDNPNLTAATTDRIVSLDYIKVRSMNISYNFDMSNSASISKLKLYLNGNNLLTFSDIGYADPEGNNIGGLLLRRYSLGLNMSF